MNVLQEISVKEAVAILKEHGSGMGESSLRAALKANVYDFGKYIPADGHYMTQDHYIVYVGPLMRFIEANSHDVSVDPELMDFMNRHYNEEENEE